MFFACPQGKIPLTGMVVSKSEETRNAFEISGMCIRAIDEYTFTILAIHNSVLLYIE